MKHFYGDPVLNFADKRVVLNADAPFNLKLNNPYNFQMLKLSDLERTPPLKPYVVHNTLQELKQYTSNLQENKDMCENSDNSMELNIVDYNSNKKYSESAANDVKAYPSEELQPCDSCGGKNKNKNKPDTKLPEANHKKKRRSFIQYDDLFLTEYPDLSLDDAFNSPPSYSRKRSSPFLSNEDDMQPCAHCGGRNKNKPQNKASLEQNANLQDSCGCRTSNVACNCNEQQEEAEEQENEGHLEKTSGGPKVERSVSDVW